MTDSFFNGSISYQGNVYENMNWYYNLVTDEIITQNYAQNAWITLSTQKIEFFKTVNHLFFNLSANKSNGLPKDGYYEQMYPGEPGFYVRREKRFVTSTASEENKYVEDEYYFVRIKNVYFPVASKKELMDLFRDEEDSLKKYIHANKLNFKKALESSLMLTTIYYSRLKH